MLSARPTTPTVTQAMGAIVWRSLIISLLIGLAAAVVSRILTLPIPGWVPFTAVAVIAFAIQLLGSIPSLRKVQHEKAKEEQKASEAVARRKEAKSLTIDPDELIGVLEKIVVPVLWTQFAHDQVAFALRRLTDYLKSDHAIPLPGDELVVTSSPSAQSYYDLVVTRGHVNVEGKAHFLVGFYRGLNVRKELEGAEPVSRIYVPITDQTAAQLKEVGQQIATKWPFH